ncbi:hypothetical protein WG902_12245 [Ramlibacter sp. PS3R-8]|uniref:hypothetical protein n=1 Tax=Ramlibacter sp. PS3R-8 TaxID=3133437 RepID=UPI00309EDE01
MKIALAFFGLPRCSAIAFPSIESNLLAPLRAAGELRIWQHLWRQERIFNPRTGEDQAVPEDNYEPFAGFEGSIVPRPDSPHPLLQRAMVHGDAWQDGFVALGNLVFQLQALYEVTQRVATAQPDVVVFARPDMLYHDPLDPADLQYALQQPDVVMLPGYESWGGCNDRFAIAGARAFKAYGGRILLADNFCERTKRPLHSETFLRYALAFAGIPVRTIALRASRMRMDCRVQAEDFSLAPSPSGRGLG